MPYNSCATIRDGQPLYTVHPDAPLDEACRLLRDHDIGALPVVRRGTCVGLLTERDLIREVLAERLFNPSIRVRDVMRPDPVVIEPEAHLTDALCTMLAGNFRHLPVVAGGGLLIDMISIRDIPPAARLEALRDIEDIEALARRARLDTRLSGMERPDPQEHGVVAEF
ncbi:CBS domain-containing protein [Mesobacterium pallidum]|uniref:CBS domain-containing protein n=1 Tax=Mesobacterium pallidum TaxID=2872037 RepID=UPI001EE22FF9|nr:CBS domain-containing protein [Mesobacterium pallidum]